jgi:peptidoglycan/LPS O-acetylase OafA/YrhL
MRKNLVKVFLQESLYTKTVTILSKITYQPEIDGLRAIAVLSVLFSHVGFTLFGGGFVGVDVFFVLSGYLITRLIVTETKERASFRFGRFYVRRIKRLFPALFCTVLFSWLGAFLLFSPAQMTNLGASIGAAVFSVSNIYFWFQDDYFAALSTTEPLLHTWSLSVEEQFYLIWPAAIVFIYKRFGQKKLVLSLVAVCLASLTLSHYLIGEDKSAAFYLLPSRVVELGIGALMVWVHPPKASWKLDISALVGIGLILFATITFDSHTNFPGFYALIPCLGTAVFIYSINSRYIVGIFRLKPVVWVGRISYSLYLVHWPIIVFYFCYTYKEPGVLAQFAIIALSLFLGWLQHHFVEERFRYIRGGNWSGRRVASMAVSCSFLITMLSFTTFHDGWAWRIPENRLTFSNVDWRQQEWNRYCKNLSPEKALELFSCQNYRNMMKDIFLWGDSHARHLVAGFSEAYPNYNIFVLYQSGCEPQLGLSNYTRAYKKEKLTQKCTQRNEDALDYFLHKEPTNIVLTSTKRSDPKTIAEATIKIVQTLEQVGHKVIVLGDFIRPGVPLKDCVTVPSILISDEMKNKRCNGDVKIQRRELQYNVDLLAFLDDIILPNEIQCPNEQCIFLYDEQLLFTDHHHLNIVGSTYFIDKLKS